MSVYKIEDFVSVGESRNIADLPTVNFGMEGVDFKLLQCDIVQGIVTTYVYLQPGIQLPPHKHTGDVFAFTHKGRWRYLEYPDVYEAGSYLYETAGSIHTLSVPTDNTEVTEVMFVIHGANINLDEEGNPTGVADAGWMHQFYVEQCRLAGHLQPDFIGSQQQ